MSDPLKLRFCVGSGYIQAKAKTEAQRLIKIISPMRDSRKPLVGIAEALNEKGAATSRGGTWTAMQVSRVIDRMVTT